MPTNYKVYRDTREKKPPEGRRKRIDLGLELLSRRILLGDVPRHGLSCRDIALWCGCTDAYIHIVERDALRKIRNKPAIRALLREARAMGGLL